jgi:tRNA (cmo5U34)-methyltransferase
MGIKNSFDAISAKYEAQRRQMLPCFDDYYNVPLMALDFPADARLRCVDLGCGTGLFAALFLKKFPNAHFTLIDLSDKMLAEARERFADHPEFEYQQADFTSLSLKGGYDVIISGIAIHHIPGPEKARLYKKICAALKPGGIFVNSDQIQGPTPFIDNLNMRLWKQCIESSGLPRAEIDAAYERMKFDVPSTVEEQVQWLKEAGFAEADCLYKWLPLATFYAKK